MGEKIIIGIDFDGTCVTHAFPKIGYEIGAPAVLKKIVENGHQLVLFTMRSDVVNPKGGDNLIHLESGNYLAEAVNWFKKHGIPLYGVNVNPTQHTWTTSPKAYCHLYIDDAALGVPLAYDTRLSDRSYVDWAQVEELLKQKGIIK